MPICVMEHKVFKHSDPDEYAQVLKKVHWDVIDVMVYMDLPNKKAAQNFMTRYAVQRYPSNSRLTNKENVDEALYQGPRFVERRPDPDDGRELP